MAQLTNQSPRTYAVGGLSIDLPMTATTIYEGSAVSNSAGSGNVAQLTAGENFEGFALQTATNTGSAGSTSITVMVDGLVQLTVAGSPALDATVYASDGNTFTTVSTSNSPVGKIIKVVSSGLCLVKFQSVGMRSI